MLYITIIIYYTLLFFCSILLPLLFLSFPSPLLPHLSPLPSLPSLLSNIPPPHFILYVSAFGYPYLYSISSKNNSDPACFIGVDG